MCLSQKGIYQLIKIWEEAFQFFKFILLISMKMEMISIACCIVVGQQRCNISNVSFCGQLEQVITGILITKLLTCQASCRGQFRISKMKAFLFFTIASSWTAQHLLVETHDKKYKSDSDALNSLEDSNPASSPTEDSTPSPSQPEDSNPTGSDYGMSIAETLGVQNSGKKWLTKFVNAPRIGRGSFDVACLGRNKNNHGAPCTT